MLQCINATVHQCYSALMLQLINGTAHQCYHVCYNTSMLRYINFTHYIYSNNVTVHHCNAMMHQCYIKKCNSASVCYNASMLQCIKVTMHHYATMHQFYTATMLHSSMLQCISASMIQCDDTIAIQSVKFVTVQLLQCGFNYASSFVLLNHVIASPGMFTPYEIP